MQRPAAPTSRRNTLQNLCACLTLTLAPEHALLRCIQHNPSMHSAAAGAPSSRQPAAVSSATVSSPLPHAGTCMQAPLCSPFNASRTALGLLACRSCLARLPPSRMPPLGCAQQRAAMLLPAPFLLRAAMHTCAQFDFNRCSPFNHGTINLFGNTHVTPRTTGGARLCHARHPVAGLPPNNRRCQALPRSASWGRPAAEGSRWPGAAASCMFVAGRTL